MSETTQSAIAMAVAAEREAVVKFLNGWRDGWHVQDRMERAAIMALVSEAIEAGKHTAALGEGE